jgi:ankyrin repeat protein
MDYDGKIQLPNEIYSAMPLTGSWTSPVRPDLTGTMVGRGIKLTALIRQDSHADVYAAEQVDKWQKWYEVKVFSRCVGSPKQNEYQKRTIKRNRARESYLQSWTLYPFIFLVFHADYGAFDQRSEYYAVLFPSMTENISLHHFRKCCPRRVATAIQTDSNKEEGFANEVEGINEDTIKSSKLNTKLSLENFGRLESSSENNASLISLYNAAILIGEKAVVQVLFRAREADITATVEHSWAMLHEAAKRGFERAVRILLAFGADIEAKNNSSWGALHYAAMSGHEALVLLLLEEGANIEARNKNRWTPLHCAAKNKHEAIVRLLLEWGSNIEAETVEGETALCLASKKGHVAMVKLLLGSQACVNAKTGLGEMPLHQAVKGGHEEVVELLYASGADMNAKSFKGETALHLAVSHGHIGVVGLLLKMGAHVNAKTSAGQTALHQAAAKRNEAMIWLLLRKGADVKAENSKGETVLQVSIRKNYKVVMWLLFDMGALPDSETKALSGATTWFTTARRKKAKSVNVTDKHQPIMQQVASKCYYLEVFEEPPAVKVSANKAATKHQSRKTLQKALQTASENGWLGMVEGLLTANVDVNAAAASWKGRTALQAAAEGGHIDIVERLLAAKADLNAAAASCYGRTALQAAAGGGHMGVVERLLAAKADVNAAAIGLGSVTALQAAAKNGHIDIVKKLKKAGATTLLN